jgi:hypothetical protein
MIADTVVTHVTQARTDAQALAIVRKYRPRILREVADLLYIDADGHGVAWLRQEIVRQART